MSKHILITGGAGFIGTNAAKTFLEHGYEVTVYDDFSRRGSRVNLDWLTATYAKNLRVVDGGLTEIDKLQAEISGADVVLHLAAQVAVTTSVTNPRRDFEVNALGSFNVLEAARLSPKKPLCLYTSTNKVYGGLEHVKVVEQKKRYAYADLPEGISEAEPLDFHSPYGCSKGTADQYFRDYSRIYDLPTVVFRQSCIYGLHQFGNEDQGWVAHFIISAVLGRALTIYGDGKQVRDLLFCDDLCDLYLRCAENPKTVAGHIYNVGGGARFTLSLLELIEILEAALGRAIKPVFGEARPGDQRIYVSNTASVSRDSGWKPTTSPEVGVRKLIEWVRANSSLFQK
jgi:CDP-paratose 2-epimerase